MSFSSIIYNQLSRFVQSFFYFSLSFPYYVSDHQFHVIIYMQSFEQEQVQECLDRLIQYDYPDYWDNYDNRGYQQILNPNQSLFLISQHLTNKKQEEKLPQTGSSSQDKEFFHESLQSQAFYNQSKPINLISRRETIIACSKSIRNRREIAIKGKSYQTQNIGKHLKSVTVKHLQILAEAKLLSVSQVNVLNTFNQSNGSIHDFQILFKSNRLSLKCRKFYSSKNFITSIMSSPKMDLKSKLIMIKYGQRLRSLTYTKIKQWKFND